MATKNITTITGYSGLAAGNHVLGIRATDSTGSKSDSTMVTQSFTKLAVPLNESISGNNYTFDQVTNASSYDIYAGDTLLGTHIDRHSYTVTIAGREWYEDWCGRNAVAFKQDTPPASDDGDKQGYVRRGSLNMTSGETNPLTNVSKLYVWANRNHGTTDGCFMGYSFTDNKDDVVVMDDDNSSPTFNGWQNPVEITITQDCTIYLWTDDD